MYYESYNDYELLYLVQEGSERALDLLFQKYYIYINKIVGKFKIPSYTKDDLVQEGVECFFESIKNFNPQKFNKTFYNYFKTALERRIYRMLNNSTYYNSNLSLEESWIKDEVKPYSILIKSYRSLLDDDFDKEIFDKCLVEGLSFHAFAKNKGTTYKKIYYRAKCICERLKKY